MASRRPPGALWGLLLAALGLCGVAYWVGTQYVPILLTAVAQRLSDRPACLDPVAHLPGGPNLSSVALVTCLFPTEDVTISLPSSPHPFGRRCSFIFTNARVRVGAGARGWTHITTAAECGDEVQCAYAAKPFKIRPGAVPALHGFRFVLYIDQKIHMNRLGFLNVISYIPRAPRHWALLVRHHEVLQYRDNGLDDEVWYAMLQPRYRQALPRIEKFMARYPSVPMRGVLHNSGLLVWDLHSPQAAEIQSFWYNATLATSPECQATFFYTYHLFKPAIVTIPFPQEGVAWYSRATSNPTTRGSLQCALNASWWAAHHGGVLLPPPATPPAVPFYCTGALPYSFNYPLLLRPG